jgi:O-acetyl-ADP-ribose deacetylase (regulator of RNase III)
MPLIHRVTHDMFEFESVMDFMVNPVNLRGVSGAGLAAVFRDKAPNHIEVYRAACRSKELRIGTVQIITDTDQPWGIINFPTKDHYVNKSEEADIKRGLIALREVLLQDQYRYAAVGMPMLGCGLGKQTYDTVYPMMIEFLGDLDATIFLSMSPDKTDIRSKYLMIAGPLDYGLTEKEQEAIDWAIEKSLEVKMGLSLSDYDGIISGGYPGVDAYIGGTDFLKDQDATYVHRKTGKPCLVVKPNKAKNGIGANLHQGNLMCEMADDVILIKPKGHNNNRLSAMQVWLASQEKIGMRTRRVAIFGDPGTDIETEDLMIEEDMPY